MVSLLPRKSSAPEPDPDEMRALRADVESLRRAQIESGLTEQRNRVDALNRERLAREAAERAQSVATPCIYCGVSKSRSGSLGWQGNPGRLVCPWCQDDRGFDRTDTEHAALVITRIISGDWKARRYPYGRQAETLIQRTGFKWWHQVPGASPGGFVPWTHIDMEAIRARATPTISEPPPRYWKGDPCPKCGFAFGWQVLGGTTWITSPEGGAGRDIITGTNPTVGCSGCDAVGINSLDDVAKAIIGVHGTVTRWPDAVTPNTYPETQSAAELLGLTWFKDRPVRSGEHVRGLSLAPFKYVGDLSEIRRRAFALFPFQGNWNPNIWTRLIAEATNSPTTTGG